MTVLEEMGMVIRSVPGADATDAEIARWYERKAALLQRIAADDPTYQGDNARLQAEAASRHAASIHSRQVYARARLAERDYADDVDVPLPRGERGHALHR